MLSLASATLPFSACGGTSRNVSDRDGNDAGLAGAVGAMGGSAGALSSGAGGRAGGRGGAGAGGGTTSGGASGSAAGAGSGAVSGAGATSGAGAAPGAGASAGGNSGDGGVAGAAGEPADCDAPEAVMVVERPATLARSAGFAGTDLDYDALEAQSCTTDASCVPPCREAGGTVEMCESGICMGTNPGRCLPTVIWRGTSTILTDGSFAQLLLYSSRWQDDLLLDHFGFQLPPAARIDGITVTIRRYGRDADTVVDRGVRLLRDGVPGLQDRSLDAPWADEPEDAVFGGPDDLWGEAWTAADLASTEFGVELGATFAVQPGGTAFVDGVRIAVTYRGCD